MMIQKIKNWFVGKGWLKDVAYIGLLGFFFITTRIEGCNRTKESEVVANLKNKLTQTVLTIHGMQQTTHVGDSLLMDRVKDLYGGLKGIMELKDLEKADQVKVREQVNKGYETISELENQFR